MKLEYYARRLQSILLRVLYGALAFIITLISIDFFIKGGGEGYFLGTVFGIASVIGWIEVIWGT